MGTSVWLCSLGCAKNTVDSEVMLGILEQAGYRLVSQPERAELIIVNTCSFIDDAVEESIDTILGLGKLKQTNGCRALVVTGCLVQSHGDELMKELPEVDGFLGPAHVASIAEGCALALEGRRFLWRDTPRYIYDHLAPRVRLTPPYYAYVKIAEGCRNHCSYCLIPSVRGQYRSRDVQSVVQEVSDLVDSGVKEINLVAQDTTLFQSGGNGSTSLPSLLRELAKPDGLEWIRLLYTHPAHFTDELIGCVGQEPRVCNYVDMPVQHSHDELLSKMNRGVSSEQVLRLIEKLRRDIPEVALRTTFMVGFPGETEEHFQHLLSFMREVQFDKVGVFTFSPQEGTPAAEFDGQVPSRVRRLRFSEAMEVQRHISWERNRQLIGKKLRVLVEAQKDEVSAPRQGRSYREAPEVDGYVLIEADDARPGDMVDVEITEAYEHDLVGRIV